MSNFEKDAKNMTGTVAKEGYEASVGARALARAGKCPNLKGHVHERESRWTRLKLTGRCVNGLVNQMATFASPGFIYARMV